MNIPFRLVLVVLASALVVILGFVLLNDSPASVELREAAAPPPSSTTPQAGEESPIEVGSGTVDLLVHAKTRFDPWTEAPSVADQETMRDIYDWMVVYSPYFDERLEWYPNGLAYIDLYAIYKDSDRDLRAEEHPDWILKDTQGNQLFIDWGCEGGTCPQWAADVGNPDFQADFISRVGQLLGKGYPGVVIDDVNLLWRISNGDGDTIVPVDPRTGEEMTLEAWRSYVVELVEAVRESFPEAKIMHNAIWYADSPTYSDELVKRQTAAADWIMLERGAVDAGLEGGDDKYSLAAFMEFADLAEEAGTGVLLLDEDATTIDEQVYNLAVYFLVNSGNDLVSTEDYPQIAPGSIWDGFLVDLGEANGPRYQWESLWRRDFAEGVVLVNDPGAAARSVSLQGSYQTIDGEPVTEVDLGPREAVILLETKP
jgi:hypothetical protein